MSNLDSGCVIRLRNFNHHTALNGGTGIVSESYKAPKGQVFACLLLGIEPLDDSSKSIHPDDFLKALGWTPPPTIAPKPTQEPGEQRA